jgi:hypothetical protein
MQYSITPETEESKSLQKNGISVMGIILANQ